MKLKAIRNIVTSKVGRQILVAQKHSPVILFAAGVTGIVATVVIASRATLKLNDVLLEAQDDTEKIRAVDNMEYTEQDRSKDLAIVYARTAVRVARMYAPALVLGGISVAALTGSHIILTRRNLAITAAYAALDRGWREYRERVVADLGVDKDRQYRYGLTEREIVEETATGPVIKTVVDVPGHPSVYARFFDETSKSWSKQASYNQIFLRCQQNYANDKLKATGHVFLNEVYDMLGIPRSREGQVVGWLLDNADNCEGDGYIDFGVFDGDPHEGMRFVLGHNDAVLLDFNVDGVIWDKI